MIYDSRLKSSKLFDEIIYVKQKEKEKVQTELCNILDQCVNTNMSGDLLEFGEYLTDPLVVREHYDCFGREKEKRRYPADRFFLPWQYRDVLQAGGCL